ncbi:MAG TPA: dihydropteroate synthase [Planctomycetaceae bacterium]|nr:dihydropteroate synthase [Planctomycetaceae bacterium]
MSDLFDRFEPLVWRFRQTAWELTGNARLMGIVNVTPDSFSDGGNYLQTERAVEHALALAGQGADVLDIGGESTRPESDPVSLKDELNRVIPVIESLRGQTDVPISIDTTKAEVARQALAAGAEIVNDISGLTFDEEMIPVCANSDCGIIVMHIRGTPRTMQDNPTYDDVVSDVRGFLSERVESMVACGIDRERIMLDPGIGFGKTAEHNLELMRNLSELRSLGRPLLIGHSRKRFLGKILGRPVDERTAGTIGVSAALSLLGADLIRVHDVAAVRDALTAFRTLLTGPGAHGRSAEID